MSGAWWRKGAAPHGAMGWVISDGCRDYVAAIDSGRGVDVLRDRRGRRRRFASIADARNALRRGGAGRVMLRQRLAHEEACAGTSDSARFSEVRIA